MIKRGILAFLLVLLILPSASATIYVLFRNDDVGYETNLIHEQKIVDLFEKHNITQTDFVVPLYQNKPLNENKELVEKLKEWNSNGLIEIGQHGLAHVSYINCSENIKKCTELAGRSYEEQYTKIMQGKDLLEEWLNITIDSFVPPWDSMDEKSVKVLKELNFKTTSTVYGKYWKIKEQEPPLFIDGNFYPEQQSFEEFKYMVESAEIHGEDQIFVLAYHTWNLTSEEDLQNMESILSYVAQDTNVKAITFKEAYENHKELALTKIYRAQNPEITSLEERFNAYPVLRSIIEPKITRDLQKDKMQFLAAIFIERLLVLIPIAILGIIGIEFLHKKTGKKKIFMYLSAGLLIVSVSVLFSSSNISERNLVLILALFVLGIESLFAFLHHWKKR